MKRVNHKIFGIMMALLPSLFLFSCNLQTKEDTKQPSELDDPEIKEELRNEIIPFDTVKFDNYVKEFNNKLKNETNIEDSTEEVKRQEFHRLFPEFTKDENKIKYADSIIKNLELLNFECSDSKRKEFRTKWIKQQLTLIKESGNGVASAQSAAINEANDKANAASEKADNAQNTAQYALLQIDSLKNEIGAAESEITTLKEELKGKYGLMGVSIIGVLFAITSILISILIANKLIGSAAKDDKDDNFPSANVTPMDNKNKEIKNIINSLAKDIKTQQERIKELETKMRKLEVKPTPPQTPPTPPTHPEPPTDAVVCEYLGDREGKLLYVSEKSKSANSLFKVYWKTPDKTVGEIEILDFQNVKYNEDIQSFIKIKSGCSFASATGYQLVKRGKVKKNGSAWELDEPMEIKTVNS